MPAGIRTTRMNSLLRKLSLSHSIKLDKKAAIKRFSPGKQRHLHTKRIQRNTEFTELAGSFESSNDNLIHDTSPGIKDSNNIRSNKFFPMFFQEDTLVS